MPKSAAWWRRYRAKHRVRLRAKARENYAANPEKAKARARKYVNYRRAYQKTPEFWEAKRRYNKTPKGKLVCRAANIKRRTRKLALPYTPHEPPMPVDGRCPYCHVALGGTYPELSVPTVDHTIPLTKGGHHVPENTKMICLGCNLIKGNRPLAYLLVAVAKKTAKNGQR